MSEPKKRELQRRARKLLATRGWIILIPDEQARPPYAELYVGDFQLTLDMQGHLQIHKPHFSHGVHGLVYDQRDPTNEGLLFFPDQGEQCLLLMRQMMVLDELANV